MNIIERDFKLNNKNIKLFGVAHFPQNNIKRLSEILDKENYDIVLLEGAFERDPILDYIEEDEIIYLLGKKGYEIIKNKNIPIAKVAIYPINIYNEIKNILAISSPYSALVSLLHWLFFNRLDPFIKQTYISAIYFIASIFGIGVLLMYEGKFPKYFENIMKTLKPIYKFTMKIYEKFPVKIFFIRDFCFAYSLEKLSKYYDNILTSVGAFHAVNIEYILTKKPKKLENFIRNFRKNIQKFKINIYHPTTLKPIKSIDLLIE